MILEKPQTEEDKGDPFSNDPFVRHKGGAQRETPYSFVNTQSVTPDISQSEIVATNFYDRAKNWAKNWANF